MRTRADFQPHFGAVSPALRPPAITALARADMVTERQVTGNREVFRTTQYPPLLILHARHGELLVVWLICLGRLAGCPITLPVILIGEGYRRTGPCRGNRPHDLQLSGVRTG